MERGGGGGRGFVREGVCVSALGIAKSVAWDFGEIQVIQTTVSACSAALVEIHTCFWKAHVWRHYSGV